MSGKFSMGYGASGYTLVSEEMAESGSSAGGGGGSSSYSGGSGATMSGLAQDGDFISSTMQVICAVQPFGPVIVRKSDGKYNIINDSNNTALPAVGGGKGLTNAKADFKNMFTSSADTIVTGCTLPRKIVESYCTKFYSDVESLASKLETLAGQRITLCRC